MNTLFVPEHGFQPLFKVFGKYVRANVGAFDSGHLEPVAAFSFEFAFVSF
jgi:hypothetical protein